MIKRALPSLAAFSAVCFSLSAQEAATSDRIESGDFTLKQATSIDLVQGPVTLERTGSFRVLNNAWYGRGPLTLVDGRLFSFPSAFGWVEGTPVDFLPDFTAEALPRMTPVGTLPRLVAPELTSAALDRGLEALCRVPAAQAAERLGLHAERARLLPAGLIALGEVARALGCSVHVGCGGLREGVVLAMLDGDGEGAGDRTRR